MTIEKATIDDLEQVEEIYKLARDYMRKSGNPRQWGNSYPDSSIILNDINNGELYSIKNGEKIEAVFVFYIGKEDAYSESLPWSRRSEYAVIHRVAKHPEAKNITKTIFSYVLSIHPYIRIDTHQDNKTMRDALLHFGFNKIGVVYYHRNGETTERIAFDYYFNSLLTKSNTPRD